MNKFFDLACTINLDRSDPFVRNQHVTAILVRRNRILSFGFNSKSSCALQRRHQPNPFACYNHAEIACIDNALKRGCKITGATMYIVRHSRGRHLGIAKPCSGCQEAIDAYRIRKVVHS